MKLYFADDLKKFDDEIAALKNKIRDLENTNAVLKTNVKSYSGKFAAAAKKLFKTVKKFETCGQEMNSEPIKGENFYLKVRIDGSQFTAIDWKISDDDSTIKSMKSVDGHVASTSAVELLITFQQTCYLPTNLGEFFPSLEVLKVTSSGLFNVHSKIFENLSNLKTLQLKINELREIPHGTFDSLINLESLDLSFNRFESLETGLFEQQTKLQNLNLANNELKSFSIEHLPPKNAIEELYLKSNKIEIINFPAKIVRVLKAAKLIDFSGNICIDLKYAKGESLGDFFLKIFDNCTEN